MSNSKRPKRRRSQRMRKHTITVVDGRVVSAPEEVPGLDQIPFMGEEMICVLCGKKQQSDPHVESNWRGIKLDRTGPTYYACPDEFPPDGANTEAFTVAYTRLLAAILERP